MRRKKLLYSYMLLFDAKFFYRRSPVLFPHAKLYEKEGRIHVSEKACRSCRCRSSRSRGKARTQDRKVRCQNGESPQNGKTAHKGRPPLSPEIYVEFAGKQYNITDLVDRAKADYRLTHKVGVQSCKIYVKPEEEAAYYVVNKVGGKLPL